MCHCRAVVLPLGLPLKSLSPAWLLSTVLHGGGDWGCQALGHVLRTCPELARSVQGRFGV